jgi:ADP-ribose pyrophosphatase YjhB (NUDIX family)
MALLPKTKATVVVLVTKEGKVILARKKQPIHHNTGEISYSLGMYNGYGGKQEADDITMEDCALRELKDESSVVASLDNLVRGPIVSFYTEKDGCNNHFMDVYFYTLSIWDGDPQEGDEMGKPEYFDKHALPYEEMMPADRFIFEWLLDGKGGEFAVYLKGKGVRPEVIEKKRVDEKEHHTQITSITMR